MRLLSELPTWNRDTGDLVMVIETPQGSRNKSVHGRLLPWVGAAAGLVVPL